jgi:predicted TIM-barrel fold metal-dependent hydrolase
MEGAAALAEACPEVNFILQHAGMLEDTSKEGRQKWETGMKLLAGQSNVISKLSGFGTFIHSNDPVFVKELVETTVGIFGAKRCLFGSNFPIEKLWTGFHDLFNAFQMAASGLSKAQQKAIFHDTAARVYRI